MTVPYHRGSNSLEIALAPSPSARNPRPSDSSKANAKTSLRHSRTPRRRDSFYSGERSFFVSNIISPPPSTPPSSTPDVETAQLALVNLSVAVVSIPPRVLSPREEQVAIQQAQRWSVTDFSSFDFGGLGADALAFNSGVAREVERKRRDTVMRDRYGAVLPGSLQLGTVRGREMPAPLELFLDELHRGPAGRGSAKEDSGSADSDSVTLSEGSSVWVHERSGTPSEDKGRTPIYKLQNVASSDASTAEAGPATPAKPKTFASPFPGTQQYASESNTDSGKSAILQSNSIQQQDNAPQTSQLPILSIGKSSSTSKRKSSHQRKPAISESRKSSGLRYFMTFDAGGNLTDNLGSTRAAAPQNNSNRAGQSTNPAVRRHLESVAKQQAADEQRRNEERARRLGIANIRREDPVPHFQSGIEIARGKHREASTHNVPAQEHTTQLRALSPPAPAPSPALAPTPTPPDPSPPRVATSESLSLPRMSSIPLNPNTPQKTPASSTHPASSQPSSNTASAARPRFYAGSPAIGWRLDAHRRWEAGVVDPVIGEWDDEYRFKSD
ncbi:hypothetical protein LTS18_006050 [Coniosporium uncinatum]|uniref:Uncharacterized protein n=1 Tax=Coniosporium uncinatum TaxID=93489 RepID=A0ACC3DAV8_9PEZI|nr:hypothetical protein LTS18_006050 [Coniosporium uncinatum]